MMVMIDMLFSMASLVSLTATATMIVMMLCGDGVDCNAFEHGDPRQFDCHCYNDYHDALSWQYDNCDAFEHGEPCQLDCHCFNNCLDALWWWWWLQCLWAWQASSVCLPLLQRLSWWFVVICDDCNALIWAWRASSVWLPLLQWLSWCYVVKVMIAMSLSMASLVSLTAAATMIIMMLRGDGDDCNAFKHGEPRRFDFRW